MAFIQEKDYLLNTEEYGIALYQDADALENRIQEWFDTPAGTVADNPSWGHNLMQYKFEPPSVILNAMTEMTILEKIRNDVADISIRSIRVDFTAIDLLIISMDAGFRTPVKLEKQL